MTTGLDSFDPAEFLRDYWQKKPLLIRKAWADWHNPMEPDELAGLACEAPVESRLVTGPANGLSVEHGPLPEDRFDRLGQEPWTLLVQAVDHHVPEVAALIEPFRFVPNWRIDDIMVSYATDGGGVGAHFDQYDVFLIQGLGQRRWELGPLCSDETPLLPHADLQLLAEFEAGDSWVLEPGDMLYVPPGVAHRGTAIGHDCMTYSVGFRAPSREDLIEGWSEDVLAGLSQADRYGDPDLAAQDNPGEITGLALSRLHAMVTERLSDKRAFARWFGKYATAPKNDIVDWGPDEAVSASEVEQALRAGAALVRNPASRFAYVRQDQGLILLMVDGEAHECAGDTVAFAEALCAQPYIAIDASQSASQSTQGLIRTLINQGCIAFDGEHGS
ncbi:cupin domain-containing protein [Parerythrobacter jejuensis]|uniref:Cupin domain-containing protein n=1 Tax=Parerythrobacter jejuensis TaxID=795812 RepID=A0A845APU2_9SPHN|nr:cupin domain-containing protein [Parerythrobacter jejuensis]MXP31407.1 cupin domain-containing protein [Parerythrobacter jejuensis]